MSPTGIPSMTWIEDVSTQLAWVEKKLRRQMSSYGDADKNELPISHAQCGRY